MTGAYWASKGASQSAGGVRRAISHITEARVGMPRCREKDRHQGFSAPSAPALRRRTDGADWQTRKARNYPKYLSSQRPLSELASSEPASSDEPKMSARPNPPPLLWGQQAWEMVPSPNPLRCGPTPRNLQGGSRGPRDASRTINI